MGTSTAVVNLPFLTALLFVDSKVENRRWHESVDFSVKLKGNQRTAYRSVNICLMVFFISTLKASFCKIGIMVDYGLPMYALSFDVKLGLMFFSCDVDVVDRPGWWKLLKIFSAAKIFFRYGKLRTLHEWLGILQLKHFMLHLLHMFFFLGLG